MSNTSGDPIYRQLRREHAHRNAQAANARLNAQIERTKVAVDRAAVAVDRAAAAGRVWQAAWKR